jgi:hypothetical protein
VSKELKLISTDFYSTEDLIEDAVLDAEDPILDIKRLAGLSDNNIGRLQEYKGEGSVVTNGSNPSITANEKIQYQNNNNVQPGSPEWFKLWFSLPYLTNEKPF